MTITALTVPKWGIEMQEATLAEWKVDVGGAVAKGGEIVDLETDKIINTHEAPATGVLVRQIGEPEQTYDVGELIGVIAEAGTSDADIDDFIANFKPVDASFEGSDTSADPDPAPTTAPTSTVPAATDSGEVRISPIAKRLAETNDIDWQNLVGTGRNGRISKQDVEAAVAANAGGAPIRQTALARAAGERMQAAKRDIPHFYLQISLTCDALQAARADYNAAYDCRVTLNDVLLKAVAVALTESPEIAVIYKDDQLFAADDAIGMAVATDDGLVAPIVSAASATALSELTAQVSDLATRARARQLTAEELQGGATTVSNLGMFGVDRFSAIINPPQTSIIAVGAAQPTALVIDGEVNVATVMHLTMSCDHRAFDGAAGARFLKRLKALVEAPAALFAA